jgi:hypothetical protein
MPASLPATYRSEHDSRPKTTPSSARLPATSLAMHTAPPFTARLDRIVQGWRKRGSIVRQPGWFRWLPPLADGPSSPSCRTCEWDSRRAAEHGPRAGEEHASPGGYDAAHGARPLIEQRTMLAKAVRAHAAEFEVCTSGGTARSRDAAETGSRGRERTRHGALHRWPGGPAAPGPDGADRARGALDRPVPRAGHWPPSLPEAEIRSRGEPTSAR